MPDMETTVTDFEPSIQAYEEFAKEELKLDEKTITNHLSTISRFLVNSQGIITKNSVKTYVDSNPSQSWKTNQLKALRRYLRDFLKLGKWIEEFSFSKPKAKIKKEAPTNDQLAQFCISLPYQTQIVFLIMLNSGLRIGEVLSLKISDISFENNMIDASNIHHGSTKSSWISFITSQTAEYLESYIVSSDVDFDENEDKLFSLHARSIQKSFQDVSEQTGISINPHLLRTVFAERCRESDIEKEYIDTFCGRTPQGMLAKNYTDYSPKALRKQYDKVEPYLTLPFSD